MSEVSREAVIKTSRKGFVLSRKIISPFSFTISMSLISGVSIGIPMDGTALISTPSDKTL